MSARSISPATVVGALIVIVLIVGGIAWQVFFSSGMSGPIRPLTAQEKADQDWLIQKAKETNGDFDKLSPEDQRRLLAEHGSAARFILQKTAHPITIAH
jgi:hypothetical protein